MNQYFVYVIELQGTYGDRPGSAVYVGSSGLPPKERFRHHMTSPKGSRHVKKHGKRLRPDLYAGVGPFRTRREAMQGEHWLAHHLERAGYHVYGACRKKYSPNCVI